MRFIFQIFVAILLFASCTGKGRQNGVRIGVDPNWYPIDFGPQTSYINGFTEEVLLDIATSTGVPFVKKTANWTSILDDLQSGKYDAVLTSLPPYNFNLAKYDFSQNFLDLGPVLIVPVNSNHRELAEMNGEFVGTITNDPAILVLQNYPEIIMRNYSSIPDLLNAIVAGEIEGALLNRLPASNYIRDLYAHSLKIASPPLTQEGLRLITLKGQKSHLIKQFDKSIESMKKKKMALLLKKWQLD